jgi:excisionase family DNA binding protein
MPAGAGAGRFLTVTEAAAVLGVCERTVYDALRKRRLRGQRIGRLWRTKREWLDEFGLSNQL